MGRNWLYLGGEAALLAQGCYVQPPSLRRLVLILGHLVWGCLSLASVELLLCGGEKAVVAQVLR